jgi:chromosome segregation ATPase
MRSPNVLNILSPGSPTGKLMRTRRENEKLQADIQNLRDTFEDINDRNHALLEEKDQVARRLDEVQQKLHRETDGYFEQSAYTKSVTHQLQEEQQKVLKLKRAVDLMEIDVQDLVAEKDTHIARLDAALSALEQDKYMLQTRLVQVEDGVVDERQRYAALERRSRDYEDDLAEAKRQRERLRLVEESKLESERSVAELRKRNDELEKEVETKAKHVAHLEEKTTSLEAAAKLQLRHLESVTNHESDLQRDLKTAQVGNVHNM